MSLGPAYSGAVPSFVLDYAPLIHLHSQESYWPASLHTHIDNSFLSGPNREHIDFPQRDPFSLLTDHYLNSENSYITSLDDVRTNPSEPWLLSEEGKPDRWGSSISPAIMILVDKSRITGVPNTLDSFWFYWYSMNWAPSIGTFQIGDHVGDWEHCMVRFVDGYPKAVHLSAHSDGAAYTYKCLNKIGTHPVVYSAIGTHAHYPSPGIHGLDRTDEGPLWDPTLNFAAFEYNPTPARDEFSAKSSMANDLLPCLRFRGRWGNHFPSSDVKWSDGPTGPQDKGLDRSGMNIQNDIINDHF